VERRKQNLTKTNKHFFPHVKVDNDISPFVLVKKFHPRSEIWKQSEFGQFFQSSQVKQPKRVKIARFVYLVSNQ
jgi:hypothetical protein